MHLPQQSLEEHFPMSLAGHYACQAMAALVRACGSQRQYSTEKHLSVGMAALVSLRDSAPR